MRSTWCAVPSRITMGIILPAVRLRWPMSALQSPFAVILATAAPASLHGFGYPGHEMRRRHCRRCGLFRAPGRPNPDKRTIPASMLLAPYFLLSCFCSGLLVVIGAAQTVPMRAMLTALPHLAGKIQSVPRQKTLKAMEQNQ